MYRCTISESVFERCVGTWIADVALWHSNCPTASFSQGCQMLNGYGILHGGIAFTFADSAFAFASNSYGRLAVSINGNMIYSKSAKEGETLFAEAKALNVTHKTADFDVNVMNEQGEIYYYFRGTVYRSSKAVLTNE